MFLRRVYTENHITTQVVLRLKHTHSLSFRISLQYGRSALLNAGHSSLLRTDFFAPCKDAKSYVYINEIWVQ